MDRQNQTFPLSRTFQESSFNCPFCTDIFSQKYDAYLYLQLHVLNFHTHEFYQLSSAGNGTCSNEEIYLGLFKSPTFHQQNSSVASPITETFSTENELTNLSNKQEDQREFSTQRTKKVAAANDSSSIEVERESSSSTSDSSSDSETQPTPVRVRRFFAEGFLERNVKGVVLEYSRTTGKRKIQRGGENVEQPIYEVVQKGIILRSKKLSRKGQYKYYLKTSEEVQFDLLQQFGKTFAVNVTGKDGVERHSRLPTTRNRETDPPEIPPNAKKVKNIPLVSPKGAKKKEKTSSFPPENRSSKEGTGNKRRSNIMGAGRKPIKFKVSKQASLVVMPNNSTRLDRAEFMENVSDCE